MHLTVTSLAVDYLHPPCHVPPRGSPATPSLHESTRDSCRISTVWIPCRTYTAQIHTWRTPVCPRVYKPSAVWWARDKPPVARWKHDKGDPNNGGATRRDTARLRYHFCQFTHKKNYFYYFVVQQNTPPLAKLVAECILPNKFLSKAYIRTGCMGRSLSIALASWHVRFNRGKIYVCVFVLTCEHS